MIEAAYRRDKTERLKFRSVCGNLWYGIPLNGGLKKTKATMFPNKKYENNTYSAAKNPEGKIVSIQNFKISLVSV